MSERSVNFLKVAPDAFSAFLEHEKVPKTMRCEHCSKHVACLYRCTDCLQSPTTCKTCVIKTHIRLPFHILSKCDSAQRFWSKCTLDDLGATVHLGHGGEACPYELNARPMTVIHERGIYAVHVYFCGCSSLGKPRATDTAQLIRAGLWPSSWTQPRTAFSFSLMRQFHLLSVHAHVNPYDYFAHLARRTDDTFPGDCQVRHHIQLR